MNTATDSQIHLMPLGLIEPDPLQPRKDFDPEHIASLADSILTEGLLQPITVRANPGKKGYFLIVAGECRWRAHRHASLATVKCIVTSEMDDEARRGRLQLIENMRRKDMTLREEAFGVERQATLGDSEAQLASSLGVTKARVIVLRLLTRLSPTIWSLIDNGAISPATAGAVVGRIPFEDAEGILLRCAGKNVNQAGVIIDDYQRQQREMDFSLVLEEAGVSEKKSFLIQQLARQLVSVASDIEKLSASDRTDFARAIGNEISGLIPQTERNKGAAAFLTSVFMRVKLVFQS